MHAAEPSGNTPATLRAAIKDLTATFANRYPNGGKYLARLNEIDKDLTGSNRAKPQAVWKAFEALQREALVGNPYVAGQPWLVEVREQYWHNHGAMGTMFQTGDDHKSDCGGLKGWRGDGGRFEVIRFGADGKVASAKKIAEAPKGVLRDPDISFDGKKILFSMRHNRLDDYHLHEINADGTGLKQLTFGSMISDIDPIYMADGKILFSSTRDMKYCQCNRHIQPNLFVMDADGANIIQISRNTLADFHASLMPDGRILYSRWEYVDRHFGPSLGLWTVNPDGTNHLLFMGNNAWSPGFMGDARVIPGTDKVVCIYGACHDLPWGALVIANRNKGLDGPEPVEHIRPASARKHISPASKKYNLRFTPGAIDNFSRIYSKYEDPWPLHDTKTGKGGGKYFMVSRSIGGIHWRYSSRDGQVNMGIFLLDVFGNEVLLYSLPGRRDNCFNPIPIAPRTKPPVIPSRVDLTKNTGVMYVNDVYLGDGDEMKGVKRGTIKWLRIIEAPDKQYFDERGGWGVDAAQVTAMNWNVTNNKRILGDVPVEADGSAHFEAPADTFFYFQALDAEKMMVQSMRSGTMVRPGETQGCIGCHEGRLSPPTRTNAKPLAMKRKPSQIQPWLNTPTVAASPDFNYLTEVQPVFDKHCIKCHDYGKDKKASAKLILAGDVGLVFNASYLSIMTKSGLRWTGPGMKIVNVICDGPPGVLPAYSWGSHRSKLVKNLRGGHNKVKVSAEEFQRVVTWIDLNGVYYGSYSSYYPGRNPIKAELGQLLALAGVKNYQQHLKTRGALVCFNRPEVSPILKMAETPGSDKYKRALEIIKLGAERLGQQPREDMLGPKTKAVFSLDVFRAKRYKRSLIEEKKSLRAHLSGGKYYQYKNGGNRTLKPSMPRGYTIPTIDLAGQTHRQVIVDREAGQYLGHPTTVLLEDNKTMICVYPKGHGRGAIVMKRSTDAGKTWSDRLKTPKTWATSREVPTLHRVVDAGGVKRIIMFSGLYPCRMAVTEDDGKTWSELKPLGDWGGIVCMGDVMALKTPGCYMAMFHDDGRFFTKSPKRHKPRRMTVYTTFSTDGGLTWNFPKEMFHRSDIGLCEPGMIRNPDGKQIAALFRENYRVRNCHVIFSDDEGKTWTTPRELPASFTGDRHKLRYAPDGRLIATFRDKTLQSPTPGDWVMWVGRYEDIVKGRPGQYRVRLMDNKHGSDCAYPGLELLPDGTFVATTYGHWTARQKPYIVSVRFKLAEIDALARKRASD